MFQISHRYTKLSTACLGALLLASASTCFAQSGGSNIIKPFRTFKANRAVVDNTNRFWPRINHVVSQKEIRPENPKLKTPLRTGNTNNLQPGNEMIRGAIAPGVGFDGIGATGWMPPDCHMAVGTNEIVEVVNSSVAFFNMARKPLSKTSALSSPVWAREPSFTTRKLFTTITRSASWSFASKRMTLPRQVRSSSEFPPATALQELGLSTASKPR